MLLERPKRLSSVHSERSRPRPKAQRCQAGVGVPAVSIRAQGSQEGRAGRSPWPGPPFYAALHDRGCRSRLPGAAVGSELVFLASQEAQAADLG